MMGQLPKASPLQFSTDSIGELQFQMIAEHVETVICLMRADGKIIYANPKLEELTGYSREELLAKNDLYDLMLPEEAAVVQAYVLQNPISAANPVNRFEYRLRRKDGEYRWLDLTLKHVVLNGQDMIIATATDVTDSKQAAEALRLSQERYRNVVDNQSELVSRFKPDTTLTFVNEPYCRAFGRTQKQMIGMSFLNLVPETEHATIREHISRVAETKEPYVYRHQVRMPSGEVRWQEWTDYPITDPSGNIVEFQSVGKDVTDQLQAEAERNQYVNWLEIIQRVDAELTQVLSFDYVLKMALDAAVRLSHANAGAIHVMDGDQMWVAHVIGNYPESMIGSRVPADQGIVGRVIQSGVPEFINDVNSDPDYVHNVVDTVAQITVPLIARDRLMGAINVQTDKPDVFTPQIFDFLKLLTARIASALENARLYDVSQNQLSELKGLYQQVSSLEQLKTQMIRVAAHDLRNPLGVISGYIQLLEIELEGKLEARLQEYLGIIKQSTDRIDKITRDILTMERIGADHELPMERIDLREIVESICDEYKPQAAQKGINLQMHLTDSPTFIWGNRAMLHETADNIVSNAIKYTPAAGQVEIRLCANDRNVTFEVKDTGFGIPEDQQEKLFQPFYRVQTKETRSIKGTGLGLHLVKSIVERHQGQMHFRSQYGEGSLFGFELPTFKRYAAQRSRKGASADPPEKA